jgi:hypothetical protein
MNVWRLSTTARLGLGLAAAVAATLVTPPPVAAQGCVASRMDAPNCSAPRNGAEHDLMASYNLPKGKWQSSLGYRWFRSHRHFVGSVEQNAENVRKGLAESDRSASEVINHTHIPVIGLTYGVTDRLSVSADLPYFHAFRRSPGNNNRPSFGTSASGISDLNLMARYWLGDPTHRSSQNLAFGLGMKLPTGPDRVEDDFLVSVNRTTGAQTFSRRPVDNSIQPGDGGYGIVAELQAFKSLGRVAVFASGNYMVTPQEQNDYLRDPTNLNPDPTSAYYSIADQYAGRVGLATSAKRIGLSLAARVEGLPGSDLVGGDMGRRRPGYSVAIEPGVSYVWKGTLASVSVPYLVRRVRTQNISDKAASARTGHKEIGDAAFADYVVIVGFSRRF